MKQSKNGGILSEDEISFFEMANAITQIKDVDSLKEIYASLSEREDVITPTDFKKAKDKVPMIYAKEVMDSLLTPESVKRRIEQGEQGLSYTKTEDGFEIIGLNGAKFNIAIHVTGLDNSQKTYNNAERWFTLERGTSTISCKLLDEELITSEKPGNKMEYGFANMSEKQVVGMGVSDLHVSHEHRMLHPKMIGAKYDHLPNVMEGIKTRIQNPRDPDTTHKYGELTFMRNDVELDKIKEGTFAGRIAPEYIIARNEITDEHKKRAEMFGKYTGKEGPIPIVLINEGAYKEREEIHHDIQPQVENNEERETKVVQVKEEEGPEI